ncbi:hypothetical protein [Paracoccus sp. NSM]|uniref:hypothetical protein n=1 Tax=Paracoccus sp. NSM TaxID=3457784 RepID=UPI004035A8D3
MRICTITADMDRAAINELMPCCDFIEAAVDAREAAAPGSAVATLHRIDGLFVLHFPGTETALVNKVSAGTDSSSYIEDVPSARDAVDSFKGLGDMPSYVREHLEEQDRICREYEARSF